MSPASLFVLLLAGAAAAPHPSAGTLATVEVGAHGVQPDAPLEALFHQHEGPRKAPCDTPECSASLIQADTTEDPAELVHADTTEEPAGLVQADTTEAPSELVKADTTEEPAGLVQADTTDAPAELVQADTTDAATELVHADTTEEPAGLVQADTTDAPAELVKADTTEEPAGLVQADTTDAPVQASDANKLAAIVTTTVKLNNMIGFAQALIAQANVMLAEDKYLNDAILTNSTGHLNQAVFNAGTNTVPNQDRLQLKINELEAEDKVMVAAFADVVPPRVTNLGA